MKNRYGILSGAAAAGITSLALLTVFLIGELYPFGWGTVSWCDMNQQIIPLFCQFKDILSGKESLFLNFSAAGGMNFYGVFFFFLASPFSFLVAFTEKSDIPLLMNLLVIAKLCLSGFTAGYVLKRLNPRLHSGIVAALGTAYSLGGYGMLFYQNIMWLDIMYLFPFVVLGMESLIKHNRPLMLTIALTLTVIMNFYISFMVFLFVIFFFGIFALLYRGADRKIYVNLGVSGVTSLLAGAVVWLPCLLQYTKSARGGSFIDGLKAVGFFSPYETTLTVILCSGLTLTGVAFTLTRLNQLKKEDRLWLYAFLLASAPLVIEPVNLMWHTGSYMSFPARYGFIPLFAATVIAARRLSEFGFKKGDRLNRIVGTAVSLIAVLISVFALLFTLENRSELSSYVNTLWNNRTSFMGILFIFGLFALVGLLIFGAASKKKICRAAVIPLICITVLLQGICSAEIFMHSAKDRLSLFGYRSVIALEKKADKEDFYRVNTSYKLTDANMTGAAGFNSISHYTSLSDKTFMEAAKKFGYSGYWMETGNWGGSLLSDALLSVGYTADMKNQEYSLKENPYYLGLGIKTENMPWEELPEGDRLALLGEAFAEMSATENPVVKYEPYDMNSCQIKPTEHGYCINNLASTGSISYEINITSPQTLYFDCYGEFSTKLTEDINNSFRVSVNGKEVASSYPTQSSNGLLKLGGFENQKVDITIEVYKTADCSSFGVFGLDESLLKDYTQNAACLNLGEGRGKIKGAAQKGTYFISLPYKDNYKVTLNGKNIAYNKALSGFIAVELPENGELEIGFTPKGFYVGGIISVLGMAIISLLVIFRKKERAYNETLSGIVYGIFLGGWGSAMLWVYIIPIFINLSDLKI